MVEAGVVSIKGKLDTTDISRGSNRIESAFKDIKATADNSNSAMGRLFGTTGNVANAVGNVAVASVGMLAGLAAFAPQTAGALASIGASTKQLAIIAGEELAPAFDYVAQTYSSLVNYLSGDSPFASLIKDATVLVGGAGLLTLITTKLGILKGIGKAVIPIAVAFSIVKNFEGLVGAGEEVGSSLASSIGASEGSYVSESLTKSGGYLAALLAGAGAGALTGSVIGSFGGPIGAAGGAAIGAAGGATYIIFQEARDAFYELDTIGGNTN